MHVSIDTHPKRHYRTALPDIAAVYEVYVPLAGRLVGLFHFNVALLCTGMIAKLFNASYVAVKTYISCEASLMICRTLTRFHQRNKSGRKQ